jgi:hypothetical protein
MQDQDLLLDAETDASLRTIAACLRWALEEVEASIAAEATPLAKVDRVAGVLEELGDRLESAIDWIPRQ